MTGCSLERRRAYQEKSVSGDARCVIADTLVTIQFNSSLKCTTPVGTRTPHGPMQHALCIYSTITKKLDEVISQMKLG